jgi:hypothetical protein
MKKSRKTLYKAKHYVIDCERNDIVDIKCGGSPMLGFDFYVDADLSERKVISWLRLALKKAGHPCLGIGALGTREVQKKDLWTQKKIWKCMHEVRFDECFISLG